MSAEPRAGARGTDDLLVEGPDADGVAILTLHRPHRRNALSIALRDAVVDALAWLARDERLKVLVFTGSGDVFCAGFDLTEFETADPDVLWSSSDRFHQAVLRFPLPTVAAVNGPALGGGFDLAVLCDIRVAADTARFAHPEHEFGDVVYAPLRELVGGALARELAFTGRVVGSAEALRIGLVSDVVAPAELAGAVSRWTQMICRAPRRHLRRTKAKVVARSMISPSVVTRDL